jgi:hypothetical protein
MDRFSYAGALTGPCGRFVLDGINTLPRVPDALILFLAAYTERPRRDSVHAPRELAMRATPSTGPGRGALELQTDGSAPPGRRRHR